MTEIKRSETPEAVEPDVEVPEAPKPSKPRKSKKQVIAPEKTPGSDTETRVARLVNLNDATFEQLRGMGMSVTQATRVIAYRERQGGFDSIDDIDQVPGFPKAFLADLKSQLSA